MSSIDAGDTANTYSCDSTWSGDGKGHDTGDLNGYVKVSQAEGYSSDLKTTMKVRPRKSGDCIVAVADAVNKHKEWSGAYCDTGDNLNVNNFDFTDLTGKPLRSVAGQVNTYKKAPQFVSFCAVDSKNGNVLKSICVEN